MDALIPADDLRQLITSLSSRKVSELRAWCELCEAFLATPSSERALVSKRLAEEYAPRITGGLSLKTIYRRAQRYREQGWRGLLHGQDLRAALGQNGAGISGNMPFIQYWSMLCAQYQRGSAAAFRALVSNLRAGQSIPGYGTWREIWRMERPGRPLPEVCPYRVGILLPNGWSQANLNRHKPNKFALRTLRTGSLSASSFLPMVPRTRAGLKRGQIIEIDDMWHDVKVRYGNAPAERCIELAMIDVATGYRTYLLKPIRRREDNTRELVMPRMMPYLLSYWLVVQGYRAEGALICGEHATAALNDRLRIVLEDVTGGKVRFQAGGLLSKPLRKGLYDARPRGNFRFKARLESSHSLVHNELSYVQGQVGATHASTPEELYGRDKEEKALQRLCDSLATTSPDLAERLQWPYIPYDDYAALVAQAVQAINDRTEHALEGWEAQGFMTGTFCDEHGLWHDIEALNALPPTVREAWIEALKQQPQSFKVRRLSPTEAWEKRKDDVIRVGRWAMPLLLGEELSVRCTVSDQCTLRVKDPEIDLDLTYAAIVHDEDGSEKLLARGQAVRVWVNPLESTVAYICDDKGRYLGFAPVLAPAHQDHLDGLKQNLGVRAHVQALEAQRIAPLLEARIQARSAAQAHNARLIAEAKADAKAKAQASVGERARTTKGTKRVSLDDLLF